WKDNRLGSADIFYKCGENVGIEETARLKAPNLHNISVFPNPFSKLIKISFSKEQGAKSIGLKIYDASGRLVRQWNYPIIRQSDHVIWQGTDNAGNHLPAGVYFIRLSNFTDAQSIPVILLR
ncbi:unnamed protein product, partial [marine sediment metagenome]